VPVAAADSLEGLRAEADQVVCLDVPADFAAVGQFYADFHGVEDAEVIACLDKARDAQANR
jgi:putative phosphoribosyl transferase